MENREKEKKNEIEMVLILNKLKYVKLEVETIKRKTFFFFVYQTKKSFL